MVLSFALVCGWWGWFFGYNYPRLWKETHVTVFSNTSYPACCAPPMVMSDDGTCYYNDPNGALGFPARLTGEFATLLISFTL